jgi:hypothetical protein
MALMRSNQTAVSTLSKMKSNVYLTDATPHPSNGQQTNGGWKEISSWPQGDWRER